MLLREHGRRHEHGHLFAAEGGLEGGANRHFGLAIATSPQIRRSMGRGASMSFFVLTMAFHWSGVSS